MKKVLYDESEGDTDVKLFNKNTFILPTNIYGLDFTCTEAS